MQQEEAGSQDILVCTGTARSLSYQIAEVPVRVWRRKAELGYLGQKHFLLCKFMAKQLEQEVFPDQVTDSSSLNPSAIHTPNNHQHPQQHQPCGNAARNPEHCHHLTHMLLTSVANPGAEELLSCAPYHTILPNLSSCFPKGHKTPTAAVS